MKEQEESFRLEIGSNKEGIFIRKKQESTSSWAERFNQTVCSSEIFDVEGNEITHEIFSFISKELELERQKAKEEVIEKVKVMLRANPAYMFPATEERFIRDLESI